MSFDEYEDSYYEGRPERLFLFQMGNTAWAYADGDTAQDFIGRRYQPTVIAMGDISQSLSESSMTVEIQIESSALVCQQFIPYQPISPMRVRVYKHHIDDMDEEYITELIGRVVSAQFDESSKMCSLLVTLAGANIDRKIPWTVYQKSCNHALYGAGCQVNRLDYQTIATVSIVDSDEISSSAFDALPDGWFTNGYVVAPSGEFRFIIGHVGSVLTLQAPFVNLPPGSVVEAYAGCDRLRTTCNSKFNNLPRFLGFPWTPIKNPFTDSVFGNAGTSKSKSKTDWRKAINPATWNGSWGLF